MLGKIRLLVQVLFTAVSNGYLIGFTQGKIYQGESKRFCVPGLNCYSCPGAVASCPIGSLQAILGTKGYHFPFYLLGFFMMVGALGGRFVCGWLCPFGLVQDLLYKIPGIRKIKKVPFDKYLRYLKYGILLVFVIGMPLLIRDAFGYGMPWFCKVICPSGTLMAGLPLVGANDNLKAAAGGLFLWKVSLLAVIVLLAILIYRPFCKYLCPLGAIYALFNRFSLFQIEIEESKCIHCHKCERVCKMGVPVLGDTNHSECIRCGECIKQCPTDAIFVTFLGNPVKKGQEREKADR